MLLQTHKPVLEGVKSSKSFDLCFASNLDAHYPFMSNSGFGIK